MTIYLKNGLRIALAPYPDAVEIFWLNDAILTVHVFFQNTTRPAPRFVPVWTLGRCGQDDILFYKKLSTDSGNISRAILRQFNVNRVLESYAFGVAFVGGMLLKIVSLGWVTNFQSMPPTNKILIPTG